MDGSSWLQLATAGAVTFAVIMIGLLIYRQIKERQAEHEGVEMQITPYVRKQAFLSPTEQRFYARLMEAVGQEVIVCPKVRLADIIDVRGDTLDWRLAWNRIAAKHVDFMLITPRDQQPLLVIVLDDARQSQDEWMYQAVIASGMPLLRIRVARDYDPQAIRRAIEQQLVTR